MLTVTCPGFALVRAPHHAPSSAAVSKPSRLPSPSVYRRWHNDSTNRCARRAALLMPRSAYPLTPLQQGMLFHGLLAPHAGVDLLQVECALAGPVDPARLWSAWSHAGGRHGVLRTCFNWTGAE